MSTYGSLILGVGLFAALGVLLYSLWAGKKAPANPWGGATLEWNCTSPPPFFNFERPPAVGDPYDFGNIIWDDESNRYVKVEPEREVVAPETPVDTPAHAGE